MTTPPCCPSCQAELDQNTLDIARSVMSRDEDDSLVIRCRRCMQNLVLVRNVTVEYRLEMFKDPPYGERHGD